MFSTPLTSRLLEPEQHPALCRRPSRRGAEAPASFGGFDADCGDLGGDDCGASARREGGPVPLRRSSEEPFLAPAAPAHREPQAGLAEDAVGASNRDAIVERALADRVVALERAAVAEAASRSACRRQREVEAEAHEAAAHALHVGHELRASREAVQAVAADSSAWWRL